MTARRGRPKNLNDPAGVAIWDAGLEPTVGTGREVLDLVHDAGITTARGRTALTLVILWHLGKVDAARVGVAIPADTYAASVIRRRAYELVDGYRQRLPPLINDRPFT